LSRAVTPIAFGAEPSGARLERIRRSPNFSQGSFQNPVPTRTVVPGAALPILRANFLAPDRRLRAPAGKIPVCRLTAADLAEPPASGLRLTWFGHSSVLAEIDGRRVLFDPVWGERCSPFRFIGPRRMHAAPVPPGQVGPVDAVVISHDHYDHLDMPSIRALLPSGAIFAVPLGVGAHLERWGVPVERIVELDWNESTEIAGLRLTATPARHFCGRGLRNSRTVLWTSWVVASPAGHRIFHSGDTGYFPGFAEIGAEHGPFDATMIQIGAYSEFWPEIHMTPEEGLRTHLDLNGGVANGMMLPIHWGTFNLAPHAWEEPAERTFAAAREVGVRLAMPVPGEGFEPGAVEGTGMGSGPAPWWREAAGRGHGAGAAQAGTASGTGTGPAVGAVAEDAGRVHASGGG
jgi:L-ascorbate metabolism protein UlaG (beta-lactamase superfamily)